MCLSRPCPPAARLPQHRPQRRGALLPSWAWRISPDQSGAQDADLAYQLLYRLGRRERNKQEPLAEWSQLKGEGFSANGHMKALKGSHRKLTQILAWSVKAWSNPGKANRGIAWNKQREWRSLGIRLACVRPGFLSCGEQMAKLIRKQMVFDWPMSFFDSLLEQQKAL